jgi:hypothetical protein
MGSGGFPSQSYALYPDFMLIFVPAGPSSMILSGGKAICQEADAQDEKFPDPAAYCLPGTRNKRLERPVVVRILNQNLYRIHKRG